MYRQEFKRSSQKPNILTVHYLDILDSCTVPSIRNCFDIRKAFTVWVKHSAKREGLLKEIIEKVSNRKEMAIFAECLYY